MLSADPVRRLSLDIGSALRYGNELEEKAKRLAEYEKQKAETKPVQDAPVKEYQVSFRVTATAEQLQGLKQYLSANNINYERI